MESNVIKLAVAKEKVVRACSTCKHRYKDMGGYRCGAVEMYCTVARMHECNEGEMWEPKPESKADPVSLSLFRRLRTWFTGGG